MKDASLSLVTKEIFKLNIERTPQLVESSGVFLVYGVFLCIWRKENVMKCCLSVIDYDKNVNILEINQENTIFLLLIVYLFAGTEKSSYLCIVKRLIDCLG